MRRSLTLFALAAWLGAMSSVGFASPERLVELWRSRYGATHVSTMAPFTGGFNLPFVANPADGSLWMIEGATVTHTAATGELLARSPALSVPERVAVDPANGTCWVATQPERDPGGQLVHLALDGHVLATTPETGDIYTLTPSPYDGSVWITGYYHQQTPDVPNSYVAHVSATGEVLFREASPDAAVIVDPNDGTAWRLTGQYATGTPQLICLNADGSAAWQVTLNDSLWIHGAEDLRDHSVWVVTGRGPVWHISATGTVLWQGTVDYWGSRVWVSPVDGSVWITHNMDPDREYGEPAEVTHLSAAGAELSFGPGEVVGANGRDGSVWVMVQDNVVPRMQHFTQYAPDGRVVNQFDLSSPWLSIAAWLSAVAYDPANNGFWGYGAVHAEGPYNPARQLVHVAQDGTVLSATPWQEWQLVGQTLSPEDGSIWVMEGGGGVPELVRVSPMGEELERRPSFSTSYWLTIKISPFDGSWWACYPGGLYGTPILVHLAPDGTELSHLDDVIDRFVINPTDGSVWGWNTTRPIDPEDVETISRVSASGGLLWQRAYPGNTHVQGPVLLADGSAWVIVYYAGGTTREHIGADGAYLGDLPLMPWMVAVGNRQWVQLDDGTSYVAFSEDSGGQLADAGVRCYTPEGVLLWEWRQGKPFLEPTSLAVNPSDRTVWVSAGSGSPERSLGDYVAHLAADGSLLGLSEGFTCPFRLVLDPRDGSVWVDDQGDAQIVHLKATRYPFNDVLEDFWAYDEIQACYDARIVTGYPDGTYQPKREVTRGQMAAFISRALCGGDGFVPTGPAEATFPDVPMDAPFFRHIEYAHAQGVVTGYQDGTYQPSWIVNRGQMAAFLARAQCGGDEYVPTGPATASFTDVPPDFGFYRYIEHIYAAGITTGYSDSTYHPEWVCNRDQMAVFVARAFQLLP